MKLFINSIKFTTQIFVSQYYDRYNIYFNLPTKNNIDYDNKRKQEIFKYIILTTYKYYIEMHGEVARAPFVPQPTNPKKKG